MRPAIAILIAFGLAAFMFGLLAGEILMVSQGPRQITVRLVNGPDDGSPLLSRIR